MSVWLCIPSARPPEEAEKVLKLWRQRGYKIALWRDDGAWHNSDLSADTVFQDSYPGYAIAVNRLIEMSAERDPQAEWFVIGGDDVEPDAGHTAEEIEMQCSRYFGLQQERISKTSRLEDRPTTIGPYSTMGVMQPTGDRFAQGSIDKIAGSAWIGREFARRMYGGNGPLWSEYRRFYMDEELQAVAEQYGVFQQRRDLIHLHRHFMRVSDDVNSPAIVTPVPAHLAHQEERWIPEQTIYRQRKALCFPESEPIP